MDEFTNRKLRSIHKSARKALKQNYSVYNALKRELEALNLSSCEMDHELQKLYKELEI